MGLERAEGPVGIHRRLTGNPNASLFSPGAPLREVQAELGQSSLAVTSRYLADVTPEDLAARARRRPAWGS